MDKRFIVAVLLFIAVSVNAASHVRIVGGSNAVIERWPFIVQVESTSTGLSWTQFCSANIINNKFVLSAASCFDGILFSPSRRRLRAGTARRGSGGVTVGVTRVLNHPNYGSSSREADISLVEQSVLWIWSPRIQAVQIPPQDFLLPDDLPVVLAGWGATREGGIFGQTASTLQEVTLQTMNREWCAEQYLNMTGRVVDEAMMCTGTDSKGLDSCTGDEGGPVYYRDEADVVTLVGIISWRSGCGSSLPSVNTRVSNYTKWIIINAL